MILYFCNCTNAAIYYFKIYENLFNHRSWNERSRDHVTLPLQAEAKRNEE